MQRTTMNVYRAECVTELEPNNSEAGSGAEPQRGGWGGGGAPPPHSKKIEKSSKILFCKSTIFELSIDHNSKTTADIEKLM